VYEFGLDDALVAELDELGRAHGASLFMVVPPAVAARRGPPGGRRPPPRGPYNHPPGPPPPGGGRARVGAPGPRAVAMRN
uniref:hypothetical protein n=1 Tax=Nocardia farcinica TaxID=37329 RepID=UPI002455AFF2